MPQGSAAITSSLDAVELPTIAEQWAAKASGDEVKRMRRSVLAHWAAANKLDVETLVKQIRDDQQQAFANGARKAPNLIYETADRMVKRINEGPGALRSTTVAKYRNALPQFFTFVDLECEARDYKAKVTRVRKVVETEDKFFEPKHLKFFMAVPDNRFRALVVMLLCSGHRISSNLKMFLRHLNLNLSPARMTFVTYNDKIAVERTCFLSAKSSQVVQEYLSERGRGKLRLMNGTLDVDPKSDWFFPSTKKHWIYKNAREQFVEVCAAAGLTDRSGVTGRFAYHAHVFRKLNLQIAKSSKYPPDWAEHVTGHTSGQTGDSYPGDEIGAQLWKVTVGPAIDKFLEGRPDWMPKWEIQ